MPCSPRSPSFGHRSRGNWLVLSISAARGAISFAEKSRTVSRIASAVSPRSKLKAPTVLEMLTKASRKRDRRPVAFYRESDHATERWRKEGPARPPSSVKIAALGQRARCVLDLAGRRIHRLRNVGNLAHARGDVGNALCCDLHVGRDTLRY